MKISLAHEIANDLPRREMPRKKGASVENRQQPVAQQAIYKSGQLGGRGLNGHPEPLVWFSRERNCALRWGLRRSKCANRYPGDRAICAQSVAR